LAKEDLFKIQKLLTQMIVFVTTNDSIFKELKEITEGPSIKIRQKIMRELYTIELLTDILYYPFTVNQQDLTTLNSENPLNYICVLCHTLIRFISQDYRANELYSSQWIELFFD
jgi:hypothetical protein